MRKQQIDAGVLLPILREEREADRQFILAALDKVGKGQPITVTSTAVAITQVTINKPAANAAMLQFNQELKSIEDLDTDLREYIQEEIAELKAEIKADKSEEAKGRWEIAWETFKQSVDVFSKFPKLFELGEKITSVIS